MPVRVLPPWVNDPAAAQRQAEKLTRPTIGTSAAPVAGVPTPPADVRVDEEVPAGV